MERVSIKDLAGHQDREVEIQGWLYNRRSSGRIHFLIIRDGTGFVQGVAPRGQVPDDQMETLAGLGQESAIRVQGEVKADSRAPGGFELSLSNVEALSEARDYPLALKEHGVDFLLDHRHLWLRTPRQIAIMRVRDTVVRAFEDFLHQEGFVRLDSPILTPAACEGTTTLFETDYFDEKAYLAQSGQLYAEAGAMALGRVYCYGPTFRAEKSKTRRHLIEFWMLEPEMAFVDHAGNMEIQEQMISYMVDRVLDRHRDELQSVLERDLSALQRVQAPFPRISYDQAIELVQKEGSDLDWGDDLGAVDERMVSDAFDRPVFVEKYPVKCKAFYMEPDPERPEVALCADLLASEGYGEIIGGSQRIHDLELLLLRIEEHNLPPEAFRWYLDLRRYGSVPHSGFGVGIERVVAWICGVEHIRECIPFPRLLNRIYP